jgi:hypothetical protein
VAPAGIECDCCVKTEWEWLAVVEGRRPLLLLTEGLYGGNVTTTTATANMCACAGVKWAWGNYWSPANQIHNKHTHMHHSMASSPIISLPFLPYFISIRPFFCQRRMGAHLLVS